MQWARGRREAGEQGGGNTQRATHSAGRNQDRLALLARVEALANVLALLCRHRSFDARDLLFASRPLQCAVLKGVLDHVERCDRLRKDDELLSHRVAARRDVEEHAKFAGVLDRCDIVKDVRGSESNREQDSREM